MNLVLRVVAVLFALVGMVWVGQGAGLIGGSVMTGSTFWLAMGIICLIVGAGLAAFSFRNTKTGE